MAITPRPKKEAPATTKSVTDEKKIEALINKGGTSTKAKTEVENPEDVKQPIRLIAYKSQLDEIETVLSKMPKRGRPSRHAYILQAIDEKLERDKKKLK